MNRPSNSESDFRKRRKICKRYIKIYRGDYNIIVNFLFIFYSSTTKMGISKCYAFNSPLFGLKYLQDGFLNSTYLQQISLNRVKNQQKYIFMKTGIYIIAKFLWESKWFLTLKSLVHSDWVCKTWLWSWYKIIVEIIQIGWKVYE